MENVEAEKLGQVFTAWRKSPRDRNRASELTLVLSEAIHAGQGLEIMCDPRVLRRRKYRIYREVQKDLKDGTELYGRMAEENCVFIVNPRILEVEGRELRSLWEIEATHEEGGLMVLRGISRSLEGLIRPQDIQDLRLINHPTRF